MLAPVGSGVGARASRLSRVRERTPHCYHRTMSGTSAARLEVTPPVTVMDSQPGEFWFGAWCNINVLVWFSSPNIEGVKRLEATNPERVRAHPEKLSTVHIAAATSGPPESEARAALNEMHKHYGDTVGCAAVVIEHGGLLGAAVRSAVTGMMMVAPKHYRVKVFDTIDPVAPWLAENHARSTGVSLAVNDVLAVLRFARAGGR
jgi:hypothetical protein